MNRRIALTGGIACGKSLVAKFLNEFGVETIDADDIVHELMPDPAARKRLAAEVFGNEAKRKELEARIHPLVKARIAGFLAGGGEDVRRETGDANGEDFRRETGDGVVSRLKSKVLLKSNVLKVAIIPLLFETHWDAEYDIICCVSSERDLQVSRMMTTRGYTREEAEARLKAQMPVEEKAAKSHYVIENNGSAEELEFKVAQFVNWLKVKNSNRQAI